MRRLLAVSLLSFATSLLLSCGGGNSQPPQPPAPPPPPITVALSGPSGVLNTGATRKFSATVSNASNLAVTWSVVEAGGGTITSDGLYTAPVLPGTFTVKATAQADTSASGTAIVPVVIPVGHVDGYEVGVNYHSTTSDNINSAFITTYNQPQVRQTVRAQLQGMADRGATLISTRIWFTREPGTTVFSNASATTFPMSDQEQANLRTYAQDVAAIQGSGGNRLQLDVDLLWLGAADYTKGSPATGLGDTPGYPPISASEFTSRVELSTDKVLTAISGVNRPDGVPVARMVYLEGGVMLGLAAPNDPPPVPNQDWFMSTHYPRFVSKVLAAGFQPSVYFVVGYDSQDAIFDNTWVDPMYPVLNGRRSMYWMYRSLKFMVDRGMYIPPRIDFAYYVYSTGGTYSDILSRVLNDADVIVPLVSGKPHPYGLTEAFYFLDSTQRRQYGQAFASEALASRRFEFVMPWTTPDGAVPGQTVSYPFAIEDYLPPPTN